MLVEGLEVVDGVWGGRCRCLVRGMCWLGCRVKGEVKGEVMRYTVRCLPGR